MNLLGQILNNVVMHEQFGSNGAATFARNVINRISSYETSTLPRKNEVSPSHHSSSPSLFKDLCVLFGWTIDVYDQFLLGELKHYSFPFHSSSLITL